MKTLIGPRNDTWRRRPARPRKRLKSGPWRDHPATPLSVARLVWAHLFPGEPWPRGWTVEWVGYMRGALGLCKYGEKRVLLNYGDGKRRGGSVLRTLVHELVHMRCGPKVRHGKDFRRIEDDLCRRLGIDDGHAVELAPAAAREAAFFERLRADRAAALRRAKGD